MNTILQKHVMFLKRILYNNPEDERLFVYRNEKRKWLGVSVNFGHPAALRHLLSCAGIVLLFVLSASLVRRDSFVFVVLVTLFLLFVSKEIRLSFRIAELGIAREKRSDSRYDKRSYQTRSRALLIVTLSTTLFPLLFVLIALPARNSAYWVFVSCLALFTFGRLMIIMSNSIRSIVQRRFK